MQDERSSRIEAYLLAAKGWVSAEDLCAAFGVTKRDLRRTRAAVRPLPAFERGSDQALLLTPP